MKHRYFFCLLLVVCAIPPTVSQSQDELSKEELFDLSLEELMNLPIVSASNKKETVFEAPLSSYTITKDDITNSGATSRYLLSKLLTNSDLITAISAALHEFLENCKPNSFVNIK